MHVATDLAIDADFFNWVVKSKPGPRKVVYFSSSAAYPISLQTPERNCVLSESMIDFSGQLGLPDMTYGWAKLTGEFLARHAAKSYGLDVVCYRPFSGYGEDQDFTYPFPSVVRRVGNRESPLVVWGSGEQTRDFIYIEDVVDAVLATLDKIKPGEALNPCARASVSFRQLAERACRTIGHQAELRNDPSKPEGAFARVGDCTENAPLGQAEDLARRGHRDRARVPSRGGVFATMTQPPLTDAYSSPDGKPAEPGGPTSLGARLSVFSRPTMTSLASVSVWQLGNYLLPLTFIPYLTRTLGVHSFGLTALATAVIAYPLLVTDWGFVLLATHRVSIARHAEGQAERDHLVCRVREGDPRFTFLPRTGFRRGAFRPGRAHTIRAVRSDGQCRGRSVLAGLGTPGDGEVRRSARGSLVGRLLAVPVIFTVVRSPADAANAVLALALGAILVAALSIAMCVRLGVLRGPTSAVQIAKSAVEQLRSGVWVFLSSLASSVYIHGLLITLGLVKGAYSVGIYSSADKIRNPISNMLSPMLMVFFPRMSALVQNDLEQAQRRALQLVAVRAPRPSYCRSF